MRKIIFFLILVLLFSGCASFRRKFVREKKKEERPRPVVYFKDYESEISYEELYKKHFLFWKYWKMELISALGENNYKKQIICLNQAIASLKNMESFLVEEKRKKVSQYREALEKIIPKIKKGAITDLEKIRLKQEMEKHFRIAERELLYPKVCDFIKKRETKNEN